MKLQIEINEAVFKNLRAFGRSMSPAKLAASIVTDHSDPRSLIGRELLLDARRQLEDAEERRAELREHAWEIEENLEHLEETNSALKAEIARLNEENQKIRTDAGLASAEDARREAALLKKQMGWDL